MLKTCSKQYAWFQENKRRVEKNKAREVPGNLLSYRTQEVLQQLLIKKGRHWRILSSSGKTGHTSYWFTQTTGSHLRNIKGKRTDD